MNPRPPEPYDPVTNQPRQIPWTRWLLLSGGALLTLVAAVALWLRSYVTISVAPDTTVLTTPLLDDGYPDYIGYLDAQNAAGVKPEENAWIAILRCCGPDDVERGKRSEHFRKLGIEPLPDEGAYFRQFYETTRMKEVPERVIIAASVAAQLPWHVRFVRLAALNVYRQAKYPVVEGMAEPPEPEPSGITRAEQAVQALGSAAQAVIDSADNSGPALALSAFEENFADGYDPYDNDDEANIQDLRPEALAKIMPAFVSPEDAQEWRREIFETARAKLLEREELITGGQAWTREECPWAAYWVDCYSPHLDALQAELGQRTKFYAPYIQEPGKHSVFAGALPPINFKRQLAMAYQLRAHLYLAEKNYPAALRDVTAILQLAALSPAHPTLLEGLVSVAVDRIAFATLREIILAPETTDEQLAAIDQILVQTARPFDLVDCVDHGERLPAIGQVVATVARGDDANLYFGTEKQADHHWERKIVHWDSVLREMNTRYDRYRDAAKTQNFQIIRQAEQFYETYPPNRKELEAHFKNPPWYLLPSTKTEVMKMKYSEIFLPNMTWGYSALLKANVRHDLARVLIALQRFHRAHQAYPAALAELVPKYLAAIPTDPFDGQPMKYIRTPAGGYRAYSVWQNGIDDGGVPNVDKNGEPDEYFGNDLVIGSPDELPRKQNFGW